MNLLAEPGRALEGSVFDGGVFGTGMISGDEATRVRLAARASTPACLLHELASDRSPTVRAAVAMNPATAPDADHKLLTDDDERVRILLGGKLATLLPGLARTGQEAALAHVRGILVTLADDVAARVRTAMAHTLTAMPDAPREVLLRLARDPLYLVSDPVLRLCPLLTEQDLLALLATPPHDRVGHSIAARQNLGADIADHIAAHAHHDAVRVLLQNRSATIKEATLDALVGRASDHPEWHGPLVQRPSLPGGAFRALLSMVADDLRGILATHVSLPPELAQALGRQLSKDDGPSAPVAPRGGEPGARPGADELAAAIVTGDLVQAVAALAAQADVPDTWVERAVSMRSSKGVMSLAWQAGLVPETGQELVALFGLPPCPAGQDGGFPYTPKEMTWQVELLARPRPASAPPEPARSATSVAPGTVGAG